jgi:uncharacterized protein (TIGR02145 family)
LGCSSVRRFSNHQQRQALKVSRNVMKTLKTFVSFSLLYTMNLQFCKNLRRSCYFFLLIYFSLLGCNKNDSGNSIVFDIDGNKYHTIIIGNQIWMVENLKTVHYRNGDPVPQIINSTDWTSARSGAYCDYNNDVSFAKTYGHYYNWHAVNDSRNLAPLGWHVPSEAEWNALINFLGGSNVAGGKLKESGLNHWITPNAGGSNSSGFTGLPGGNRSNLSGNFGTMGVVGRWWSSTEAPFGISTSWHFDLFNATADVNLDNSFKENGFSVRCIKD